MYGAGAGALAVMRPALKARALPRGVPQLGGGLLALRLEDMGHLKHGHAVPPSDGCHLTAPGGRRELAGGGGPPPRLRPAWLRYRAPPDARGRAPCPRRRRRR